MGAPAEAITMPVAPMTGEEHVLAGQLSFDEMLAAEGQTRSLFNSLKTSRPGKFLTELALVASGLIGGGEGVLSSAASAAPVAHEASGGWTVYGGDPLFPGGVHSRSQFVADITSTKGQATMKYMGLDSKEIGAIDTAAREGKETLRHFAFGTKFKKMGFGINGASVDTNVSFEDPRYPNGFDAYDLKVQLKTTKIVDKNVHGKETEVKKTTTEQLEIDMATVCGNIALLNEKFSSKATPIQKKAHAIPAPKSTPAPAPSPAAAAPNCSGDTANTSTGVGGQGGDCSVNKPVTICSPVNSPNSVVCSTPPEAPPTPPALTPPTIEFTALPPAQEQFTDGTTNQDCATAISPNGDAELVEFSASDTNGSIGPVYQPDSIDAPNLYCAEVTIADGDNSADPSFSVVGKVTDIVTGLSATAVDNMGTQSMPSFGN